MEEKRGYEISRKKAKDILKRITDDCKKGYFKPFKELERVILNIGMQLNIFLNTDTNKDKKKQTITLTITELATLKANDYISGKVPDWYYPVLNKL